jgi:hypothetical protein
MMASMTRTLRPAAWTLLLCAACQNGSPSRATASAPGSGLVTSAPPNSAPATPANAPAPQGVQAFGAAFETGEQVALSSLLANPAAYADKTVTTSGKVQRACSRRGCWMEIGSGEEACRVTFKDYGFFVPTDSAGAHARVQGRLDTHVVAADRVAHLESEGARFKTKQADGSALEVAFVASAVELAR